MFDYMNDDIELDDESNENFKRQLILEQIEEIELSIEQDGYLIESETDKLPEKEKLKRELKAEALSRMETAARTKADFEAVISRWDKLDANRERKERFHELSRSGDNLPLDYGAIEDGLCHPESLNGFLMQQIRKGDFLEAVFFCPYEIHELVTDEYISHILCELPEGQKDLLFHSAVLQYSTMCIAEMRGQTDRNIRKIRSTMIKKIQKKLLNYLQSGRRTPQELTLNEKQFIERNKKSLLGKSKKGEGIHNGGAVDEKSV